MRILITGASGLIGRVLTKTLSRSHSLFLTDVRSPEETADQDYIKISQQSMFLKIDLSDHSAVKDVFSLSEPEAVIHLAAVLGRKTPWEIILSSNINSSINVLETALSSKVDRVIYASTNNVYGGYEEEATAHGRSLYLQERPLLLREDMLVKPDSRYAVAKLIIEEYASFLSNRFGLRTIGLRIGTVREIDDPDSQTVEADLIPRFKSTWLYHEDLIQLINLCLVTEVKHGVYNAISRYPGLPGVFIDISKSIEELGYNPKGRRYVR